jgi:hypothetical protein
MTTAATTTNFRELLAAEALLCLQMPAKSSARQAARKVRTDLESMVQQWRRAGGDGGSGDDR